MMKLPSVMADGAGLTLAFKQIEILEKRREGFSIDERLKQYLQRELKKWAQEHFRDFPWRHTQDPYAILVAETMLQQTKAERVVPVFEAFMERYPNLSVLTQASQDELAELIYPLGLLHRGLRLKELARIVSDRNGGQLPKDEADLLKLPGIGQYTARAICANAHYQPLAVLDTNIARILERFFGLARPKIRGRDLHLWRVAEAIAPKKQTWRWNLILIDFGALVCTAAKPKCPECPLSRKCTYFANRGG